MHRTKPTFFPGLLLFLPSLYLIYSTIKTTRTGIPVTMAVEYDFYTKRNIRLTGYTPDHWQNLQSEAGTIAQLRRRI